MVRATSRTISAITWISVDVAYNLELLQINDKLFPPHVLGPLDAARKALTNGLSPG